MKHLIRDFTISPQLLMVAGAFATISYITIQSILVSSPITIAKDNDDFPGDRLGGGTQWVTPSDYHVDYVSYRVK